MKTIPCEKLARNWSYLRKMCTTPFTEQRKRAITRIEKEVVFLSAQLCTKWGVCITEKNIWEAQNKWKSSNVYLPTHCFKQLLTKATEPLLNIIKSKYRNLLNRQLSNPGLKEPGLSLSPVSCPTIGQCQISLLFPIS